MSDRYELVETNYVTDKRIVHISNVSWAFADALRDILEPKFVGRLTIENMMEPIEEMMEPSDD